jgi:diguanylate cyclase (GGDEF)-like protein/PAS domain S-box-containing protein
LEHIFKSLSYESFINFYELLHTPVMITEPKGDSEHRKIIYVNAAFLELTGYERDEIIDQCPTILHGKLTDRHIIAEMDGELLSGQDTEGEIFNYTKKGTPYRVYWDIYPLKDDRGNVIAFVTYQRNITPEYLLLQHRKLFQKAIDQSSAHIALFDTSGRYIYANKAYIVRSGYTLDELLGQHPKILKSGEHTESFYKTLWSTLEQGLSYEAIFINRNAHGVQYHEMQTITPIVESETVIGYIVIGKNYDSEIDKRQELLAESVTDVLTGLLNRKVLDQKLNNAVERYHEKNETYCMLFIDVDNFKQVNDRLGHDKGDEALKQIATLLQGTIRQTDDLIRYGGDEFICLLYNSHIDIAEKVSHKMRQAVLECDMLRGMEVSLSIGYSEYDGEPIHQFVKETDSRMYQEKVAHKLQ